MWTELPSLLMTCAGDDARLRGPSSRLMRDLQWVGPQGMRVVVIWCSDAAGKEAGSSVCVTGKKPAQQSGCPPGLHVKLACAALLWGWLGILR